MKRSLPRLLLVIIWVGIPIFLWLQPAEYFNVGRALCPSKLIFDTECLGCGLIRATQHAMHFQFKDAFEFNKLIIITFPACVVLFFHVLGLIIKRPMFTFIEKAYKREKK